MQDQVSADLITVPARYVARFWNRVARVAGSCWLWTASKTPDGYGRFRIGGASWEYAHRVSVVLSGRALARGQHVLHQCDTPACVNPDHLRIGTHLENIGERDARGRQAKGSRIGRARLSDALVAQIRVEYANGATGPNLARKFGVSHQAIYTIVNRQTWRHVA